MNPRAVSPFLLGERPLGLDDVEALVDRTLRFAGVREEVVLRNEKARRALEARLERDGVVYGVTTGFGDSCETRVSGELVRELPKNLYRFHGCGVGEVFSPNETRAILVARLGSLATGYSAVRRVVLDRLVAFLDHDLLPLVPSLGSVGASGDLTPLSYVAAALSGEGQVLYRGEIVEARAALAASGLAPVELEPKESLALMNGTSVMTGLAALALPRALRLARWAAALTAGLSEALLGEPRHFDRRLFEAKPHPGQARVAAWIRADLDFDARVAAAGTTSVRVQDRYSIRCAPHVIGVLVDLEPALRTLVETELNGANDNPLVDPETGDVLHGGNFYGGHVAAAMDTLKTQVANLADLLDRQLALACNPTTNHGLPANLTGAPEERRAAHHGFKAMQITASALTAEALKATMPASVFSRSTENHNQDKVSMGTIAARDALRVLELTETVAAIVTLATLQAVDLRPAGTCRGRILRLREVVRETVPRHTFDRPMASDIEHVLELARSGRLPFGAPLDS